jgi:hypothetical protein
MFCNQCGTQVPEGVAFCPSCGAPTLQPPKKVHPGELTVDQQGTPVARMTDPLAVGSLAMGIASFLVLPIIGGIAAIILGHLAKASIRRSSGTREGRGIATGGLVLGYLNLALAVAVTLLVIIGIGGLLFGASR